MLQSNCMYAKSRYSVDYLVWVKKKIYLFRVALSFAVDIQLKFFIPYNKTFNFVLYRW